MKKWTSLALSTLLAVSALSSCTEQPAEVSSAAAQSSGPAKATLTVMVSQMEAERYQLAANLFSQAHDSAIPCRITSPAVLEDGGEDWTRVSSELMAGTGPDVIILDPYNGWDVEKMIRSGLFADLEPAFEERGFDWSPFPEALMEAGVRDGARYFVPLTYRLPFLYTTRSALEETGFSAENCTDYAAFLDEAERLSSGPDARPLFDYGGRYLRSFPRYAGLSYLDFETGEADFSDPLWERSFALLKENYLREQEIESLVYDFGADRAANSLETGEMLLHMPITVEQLMDFERMVSTFDEPVCFPLRNAEGGVTAAIQEMAVVRSNSENAELAADYIEILLSEELAQKTAGIYGAPLFFARTESNRLIFEKYKSLPLSHLSRYGYPTAAPELPDATEEWFSQLLSCADEITRAQPYWTNDPLMDSMEGYLNGEMEYGPAIAEAEAMVERYLSE